MNCEQVDFILDANAPEELTLPQKEALDRHFAACCECRAAWAAYRELAAVQIPRTPHDLRPRIAAALAASGAGKSRAVRRSLVLGGVVAVGAAAAATIAVQFGDDTTAPADRIEEPVAVAAQQSPTAPEATPVSAAPADDGASTDGPDEPSVAAASTAQYALDPYSLVVLLVPNPAVEAQATAWLAQCHEEVVRHLSALDGLNVIAGERVSPYAGSDLAPEDIARQLGAGSVLVVGTADQATLDRVVAGRAELGLASPRLGSCLAQQIDAETGAVRANVGRTTPEWEADTALAVAENVAERIRETTLEDRAALIAAAQASVLDAALDDRERVAALARLREGPEFVEPRAVGPSGEPILLVRTPLEPITEAYDEAVVAAAAQIGMTSPDAAARQAAWRGLRGVRHPYAIEALLHSLTNDADENVRCGAALALGYVGEEPGVTEALTRAAAEDPAEHPSGRPGCILSVREAAERALLSDAELRESALRTVLDETLPNAERIRPLYQSVDGRGFPVPLSDEAARVVFDIGRSAEDAILRSRSWDSLSGIRHPDFTQTLLDDVAGHPVENVRASAAAALTAYADAAAVRAALEQAQGDASMSVRRAARSALEGGGR